MISMRMLAWLHVDTVAAVFTDYSATIVSASPNVAVQTRGRAGSRHHFHANIQGEAVYMWRLW